MYLSLGDVTQADFPADWRCLCDPNKCCLEGPQRLVPRRNENMVTDQTSITR